MPVLYSSEQPPPFLFIQCLALRLSQRVRAQVPGLLWRLWALGAPLYSLPFLLLFPTVEGVDLVFFSVWFLPQLQLPAAAVIECPIADIIDGAVNKVVAVSCQNWYVMVIVDMEAKLPVEVV